MKNRSFFFRGMRVGLPFLLVIFPFGLLFGAVATKSGLDIIQTMAMTTFVIAGASQFSAVALLSDNAPTLIILAVSLAINLRMAMYSASLATHIGEAALNQRFLAAYAMIDQTYAASVLEYDNRPEMSLDDKLRYYFGLAATVVPVWILSTLVGALVGEKIPPEYSLDFAVPITFIALVAPMLHTMAHKAAALVSVVLGLLLAGLPYSSGLFIAAGAAMMVGAFVEQWQSSHLSVSGTPGVSNE